MTMHEQNEILNKAIIDNFINGNLRDAKSLAVTVPGWSLREYCQDLGYSQEKSALISDYLKGRDCWDKLCKLMEV